MNERRVFTKHDLVEQLTQLGLARGDVALVRADFGKLGRLERPGDRVFVESLLEVVGPHGAILALTHSPFQLAFRRNPAYVYEPKSAPCVIGRFADTILSWDSGYRSAHPTCSMGAIGKPGIDMLRGHDHTSTCFGPMRDLIEADGKVLVAGCTMNSPGSATIHYAYEVLGLATNSLLSGLIGCYFRKGSQVRWFHQRDVPGCSMGYHKFYPLYRAQGVLREGRIGAGDAFLIRAVDAFAIEKTAITRDPRCSLCDNPDCFSCRATKLFNVTDMPGYYWKHGPKLVWRLLRKGLAA
jgi:aminoglycoside 3-N-acetyltransferase